MRKFWLLLWCLVGSCQCIAPPTQTALEADGGCLTGYVPCGNVCELGACASVDAGKPDAGVPDAGQPDAAIDGGLDGGSEADAGLDAGGGADGGRCVDGQDCAPPSGRPCYAGTVACVGDASVCIERYLDPGTGCDGGVCDGSGRCVPCTNGASCNTPPNRCAQGMLRCQPTVECIDKPDSGFVAGAPCRDSDGGFVCNGAGVCSECHPEELCFDNPSSCFSGVVSCLGGVRTCRDAVKLQPGSRCDGGFCAPDGGCFPCRDGQRCHDRDRPCFPETFRCGTGVELCVESQLTAGTACPTSMGEVCNSAGVCVPCASGAPCISGCQQGTLQCSPALSCMVAGKLDAGATCDAPDAGTSGGGVCNDDGACIACRAGDFCVGPDTCRTYAIACGSNGPVCQPQGQTNNGTRCDGGVCNNGVCSPCDGGAPCPASNPCEVGVTSCTTGVPSCVGQSLRPDSAPCGPNRVCRAGSCVSCISGALCSVNVCSEGRTDCSVGGVQRCIDQNIAVDAGTACGSAAFCNGTQCTNGCFIAGVFYPPDAGKPGNEACQRCVPTQNPQAWTSVTDGTSCGSNLFCNGGVCRACQGGLDCDPGISCRVGTTSCASGSSTCVMPRNADAGTSCGLGSICLTDGTCQSACLIQGVLRMANEANPSNPCEACKPLQSTSSWSAQDAGTACAAGSVCRGTTCAPCDAGVSCTPMGNACHVGTISCSTGNPLCAESNVNVPAGTSCGTNQVCTSAGSCVTCVADAGCAPANDCHLGRTSCATGASVCVDTGTSAPGGTVCGTGGGVCTNGSCQLCNAGSSCEPSNKCHLGAYRCDAGLECAELTPIQNAPNGKVCGTDQVCNAGQCVACTAGVSCAPGGNVCRLGSTVCGSGTLACSDQGAAPNGTLCDGGVCNVGACMPCVSGVACTLPADCRVAHTACGSGTSSCVPDVPTAFRSAGSTCDVGKVCNSAGACVACTSGACTPPTACVVWTQSCSSGAPVCSPTATQLPTGTACGTGQVCNAGTCASGCFIGNTFFAANTVNPGNPCEFCEPMTSTTAWATRPVGYFCDNQNPKVCNPSNQCVSGCYIDSVFRAGGALDPSNGCSRCDPSQSRVLWTDADNATPCLAGIGGNVEGLCASGQCCVNGCVTAGGTCLRINEQSAECGQSATQCTPCPSGICAQGQCQL